jgi:hypothetical protein
MAAAGEDKDAKAGYEAMQGGAERGLVQVLNRKRPDRRWRFRKRTRREYRLPPDCSLGCVQHIGL